MISNITTVGTIANGTWNGDAIGDSYISSAGTWNAKQAALTAGSNINISGTTISTKTNSNMTKLNTVEYTVTVAAKTSLHPYYNSGSSSAYFIDGEESPILTFVSGITYKFLVNDSSNSGHPIKFYNDVDKTSEYTTNVSTSGTAGSANAYVQITITDSTPTKLFYQCGSHSKMGNHLLVKGYANISNVVYTIGNQNIGGEKTFTSNTTIAANLSLSRDYGHIDTSDYNFGNITAPLSITDTTPGNQSWKFFNYDNGDLGLISSGYGNFPINNGTKQAGVRFQPNGVIMHGTNNVMPLELRNDDTSANSKTKLGIRNNSASGQSSIAYWRHNNNAWIQGYDINSSCFKLAYHLSDLNTNTRLTVTSVGNVGIGTNGPDRKLDILDASNPQLRLTHTDDGSNNYGTDLQSDADSLLTVTPVETGKNVVMKLKSTSSGASKLFIERDTGNPLHIGISNTHAFFWNNDSQPIHFGVGGAERMIINNSGNVGIGTSTPNSTLEVNGNFKTSGTSNLNGAVNLGDASGDDITFNGRLASHILPKTNASYDLGSAQYKIRHLFLSDNSLWVGDTHKISVSSNGKMKFRKRKTSSVPAAITAAGGNEAGARTHSGESNLTDIKLYQWEAYMKTLSGQGSATIKDIFRDNDVDYDDNNEFGKLNVVNDDNNEYYCIPFVKSATGEVDVASNTNLKFNPSTGKIQLANGAVDNYVLTSDANGIATWKATQASGFAEKIYEGHAVVECFNNLNNDYITFSTSSNDTNSVERMRITKDGNVGIGTTTPNSKLEINGDLKITNGTDTYHDFDNSFYTSYTPIKLINSNNGNTYITLDNTNGNATFSGNLTVATPTSNNHAATKSYVDNAVQGLDVKDSCRACYY